MSVITIGCLRVLQWNCRSILSAVTDLLYLISQNSPDVILLQETWLSSGQTFHLPNYKCFRLDRNSRGGGIAFFIASKFCHRAKVVFQTMSSDHEVLVLEIETPGSGPITLVNSYFPIGVKDERILDSAQSLCRPNTLLAGDFNSHHVSWGYRTDASGKILWNWICKNNYTCLNSKVPTFVRGTSRSVLDLSFASSTLLISSWSVANTATNSDHCPIVIDINYSLVPLDIPTHSFVNYSKFKTCLQSALSSLTNSDSDIKAMSLCSVLKCSMKKSQFTVTSAKERPVSGWWDSECEREYRRRKAAWKKLLHNQCPTNWSNYKFAKAMFKRTVSMVKAKYDENRYTFLSKSRNKKALFRFLRSRKIIPSPINIESVVLSPSELADLLDGIALGLQKRFTSQLQSVFPKPSCVNDFERVAIEELASVVHTLPNSAPGPDGISTGMLKLLFEVSSQDLLNLVNYSLKNGWVPPDWRTAKIIPLLKKQGGGVHIDNIRPIALTSHVIKLIERVVYNRINKFIAANSILSPCQIGFRPGYSIWFAHVDLEGRIKLARHRRQYSALVTLDLAKAYDSVEHATLLNCLTNLNFPQYIINWLYEFLKDRKFYCSQRGLSSPKYSQSRGVPQGSVLSPVLFNVLLSSVPMKTNVHLYVYADDIAFFSSACDIQSLHATLQSYLGTLELWFEQIRMTLNVSKCSVIVFPLNAPISISLQYRQEIIPQKDCVKYLGVFYDEKLTWLHHIEHIKSKATRNIGMLRKLGRHPTGLRRDNLLMIYRMYVRPILEFGCVLFSGGPAYKINPLVLLEREALRSCLGVPKFTANSVLYQEARVPTLTCRFRILTVKTYLKIYASSLRRLQFVFISESRSFFNEPWSRIHKPQVLFVQEQLDPLQVNIRNIVSNDYSLAKTKIEFDDIFPSNSKFLPSRYLKGLLEDHLGQLGIFNVIATDASMREEKAGVGIFSEALSWSFSLRLPDYTPIFEAELLAILLALRKLSANESSAVIVTDSKSM